MADLRTIDQLEGALSSAHTMRIRQQVIESGGDFQQYQDALSEALQLGEEADAWVSWILNQPSEFQQRVLELFEHFSASQDYISQLAKQANGDVDTLNALMLSEAGL